MPASPQQIGVGMAAGSALGYAGTIIFQTVLADDGLPSSTVLSIRFAISGLVLLGLCALRGMPLLPDRGERLPIFLLGALCYMVEASLFFAATRHGSPAAVIVLVYLYPAFVTLAEAVQSRRWPSTRVLSALALSVVGCALVAVAGGRVSIEPIGVVLALVTAATFALYVLLGARVGTRTDPMLMSAWVAIGACTTFAFRAVIGPGYASTDGHWPALAGNGLANVVAFGLMFAALSRLGPARASVVFTLEAVFTVILSALVLGESLAPMQLVGAAAVLVAAATMLRTQEDAEIVEHEVAVP